MKIVNIKKPLEEGAVNLDVQMKGPTKPKDAVDTHVVLQYARYLVEHLSDILLQFHNPLRKAAFFGAVFNGVPKYEILVGGTRKRAHIPEVHELFRIGCFENPNMVNHRARWVETLFGELEYLEPRLKVLGIN